MKGRYIRVSTANQNLERQLCKKYPDEVIFLDMVSGAVPFRERVGGQKVLQKVTEGSMKFLSVSSIDRLGRNLFDILSTIEDLNAHGVVLKVDNLGLESLVHGKPNSAFRLIISVMANIAEMERETLLERQQEGIRLAKARGVYKGRSRGSVEDSENFIKKYPEAVKSLKKGNSLRDTAKIGGISVATVQKLKRVLQL